MDELLTMRPKSTTTPPEFLTFEGRPAFLFGGGGTSFSEFRGCFRGRPTRRLAPSTTSFDLGRPRLRFGLTEVVVGHGSPRGGPAANFSADSGTGWLLTRTFWDRGDVDNHGNKIAAMVSVSIQGPNTND
jgi:hypothetical protein